MCLTVAAALVREVGARRRAVERAGEYRPPVPCYSSTWLLPAIGAFMIAGH
jgi:hypothetical protein